MTKHDQIKPFPAQILLKNPIKSSISAMDHMNHLIFRHSLKFGAEKTLFGGKSSDHVNIRLMK